MQESAPPSLEFPPPKDLQKLVPLLSFLTRDCEASGQPVAVDDLIATFRDSLTRESTWYADGLHDNLRRAAGIERTALADVTVDDQLPEELYVEIKLNHVRRWLHGQKRALHAALVPFMKTLKTQDIAAVESFFTDLDTLLSQAAEYAEAEGETEPVGDLTTEDTFWDRLQSGGVAQGVSSHIESFQQNFASTPSAEVQQEEEQLRKSRVKAILAGFVADVAGMPDTSGQIEGLVTQLLELLESEMDSTDLVVALWQIQCLLIDTIDSLCDEHVLAQHEQWIESGLRLCSEASYDTLSDDEISAEIANLKRSGGQSTVAIDVRNLWSVVSSTLMKLLSPAQCKAWAQLQNWTRNLDEFVSGAEYQAREDLAGRLQATNIDDDSSAEEVYTRTEEFLGDTQSQVMQEVETLAASAYSGADRALLEDLLIDLARHIEHAQSSSSSNRAPMNTFLESLLTDGGLLLEQLRQEHAILCWHVMQRIDCKAQLTTDGDIQMLTIQPQAGAVEELLPALALYNFGGVLRQELAEVIDPLIWHTLSPQHRAFLLQNESAWQGAQVASGLAWAEMRGAGLHDQLIGVLLLKYGPAVAPLLARCMQYYGLFYQTSANAHPHDAVATHRDMAARQKAALATLLAGHGFISYVPQKGGKVQGTPVRCRLGGLPMQFIPAVCLHNGQEIDVSLPKDASTKLNAALMALSSMQADNGEGEEMLEF